jgi:hypothetical protein
MEKTKHSQNCLVEQKRISRKEMFHYNYTNYQSRESNKYRSYDVPNIVSVEKYSSYTVQQTVMRKLVL